MGERIEDELKYRIASRREFDVFSESLGRPHTVERQRNYYLDTPALRLHAQGILLRVRVLEGENRIHLTVKVATHIEPGRIIAREHEVELPHEHTAAIFAAPRSELARLEMPILREALDAAASEPIKVVGELLTYRRLFALPLGELALDVVAFPGAVEYEVELETADAEAGRRFLEASMARLGVRAWPENEPKTGRLFRRLGDDRPAGPC